MSKLKRNTIIDSRSAIVIQCVKDHFQFDLMSLTGLKSRRRDIVEMRSIAYKLISINTNISLAKIGAYFDKDHATVRHGIFLCDDLIDFQKGFVEDYKAVKKACDKHISFLNNVDRKVEDSFYSELKKSIIQEKIAELEKELLSLEIESNE
ncbi:MAG: helix-turn-helix domain-containing protein [Flavobacteriales bacterium]